MLVDDNPFEGHKFNKTDLSTRKVVISSSDLEKAIDAATCQNWKSYLAILRWTGCRKSEGFKVKWTDVDFAKKRIRIASDKTKKSGKGFRELPLFPQLEEVLAHAWSVSEKGTEYVVNGEIRPSKDKQGRETVNLDKPFKKILADAKGRTLGQAIPEHSSDQRKRVDSRRIYPPCGACLDGAYERRGGRQLSDPDRVRL